MQYKTIVIDQYQFINRKQSMKMELVYEKEINQMAVNGWKLLGIHTVSVSRRTSCWKMMTFQFREQITVDVLVFFREDDSGQVMDYPPENTIQQYDNMSARSEEEPKTPKKTMQERTMSVVSNVSSKVSGIASNAAEFLNSEETAQKMMDIKKKAASAMDAVSSKASGISDSAREKMENGTQNSDDESENS